MSVHNKAIYLARSNELSFLLSVHLDAKKEKSEVKIIFIPI